jgi:formate hydrogenlyase subunit 3/multisubunit Na+/H+ antiporter MnhD subunit
VQGLTILVLNLLPFLSGILITLVDRRREHVVTKIATALAILYNVCFLFLAMQWVLGNFRDMDIRWFKLYESDQYEFSLAAYIDRIGIIFLALTAFLSSLVISYSRYYLHRDPNFQRFFACMSFFIGGITILVTAGTMDLLIAGWEVVGISSFLLIGFYQERKQPVRNALKVFSVYRFCDIGLLLSAWMMHLFWQDMHYFAAVNSADGLAQIIQTPALPLVAISTCLLLAAAGKSAQFPFSFWLSRAMEGPTPSSAIFYGALSVHAGVFLLLRTFPIWFSADVARWMVGIIGGLTVVVCQCIGRVQPNIKGQIAYASAAQVGLQFIELSLGWRHLAELHLIGNACLRCYQLLVSPSVVAYLLRLQGSVTGKSMFGAASMPKLLPPQLASTLYVFSLNDGYLERLLRGVLWTPWFSIGRALYRQSRYFLWCIIPLLLMALMLINFDGDVFTMVAVLILVALAACLALVGIGADSAIHMWTCAVFSNCLIGTSIQAANHSVSQDYLFFLSGCLLFGAVGIAGLRFAREFTKMPPSGSYLGLVQFRPGVVFVLLFAFLGVAGFPIGPTFLGQDALLHGAHGQYWWLAIAFVLLITLNGYSLARLYTKVGLGSDRI